MLVPLFLLEQKFLVGLMVVPRSLLVWALVVVPLCLHFHHSWFQDIKYLKLNFSFLCLQKVQLLLVCLFDPEIGMKKTLKLGFGR